MKKIFGSISILAAVFSLLFFCGCAAHKVEKVEYSGFLKNYDELTPGAKDQAVMVYRNPNVDVKLYNKIMLDRVRIYPSPNANQGIDPDELKELADYFNQAMVKELQGTYELVDQPGPGVMHIRTAITNVVPGNPLTGTTSSLIPVGMVVAGTKGAVSGSGVGVGSAAAEIEILDAVTGVRLGAAVDQRVGGQAPFKGKLTDAKNAMDHWAKRIRLRLDQERSAQ